MSSVFICNSVYDLYERKVIFCYVTYLVTDILFRENIEADLSPFRNVLGADAAMFTIIKSWKRSKIGGSLTAGVEYILRSTKTGETLYRREVADRVILTQTKSVR